MQYLCNHESNGIQCIHCAADYTGLAGLLAHLKIVYLLTYYLFPTPRPIRSFCSSALQNDIVVEDTHKKVLL